MLLPSLGENFGYVILEALIAGCPILISDRSPWRDLPQKFAGYDLSLDCPSEFGKAIERFAEMDSAEFSRWSRGARSLGVAYCRNKALLEPMRAMLNGAISRSPVRS